MKRIPIMTFVLSIILIVNVIVLALTGSALLSGNKTKKYVPNSNAISEDHSSIRYYEVKKGNVIEYDYFDSVFEYESFAFSTYKIDNASDFSLFDEVSNGQILGSYSSSDVTCAYDGRIVEITPDSDGVFLKIFNYEAIYVSVSFDYSMFYSIDFSNCNFSMIFSNVSYELVYDSVIYNSSTSENLKVKFKIKNFHKFVSSGYNIEVRKEKKIYKDVFYLDFCPELYANCQKEFKYNNDGQIEIVYVYCEYSLNDGTVIISGYLSEGMKIYD